MRSWGRCLHEVGTMGHIPVVLHNLLDDLVFLVVQNSGIKIPLDLVLEDRVFLSCEDKKEDRKAWITNSIM